MIVKLDIGQKYILFSKRGAIANRKVVIESILNYDQVRVHLSQIQATILNEHVIITDDDLEGYLKNKFFYVSRTLSDNPEIIVIWDDILDVANTTLLSITQRYTLDLGIRVDNNHSLTEIENDIKTHILGNYSGKITVNLTRVGQVGASEDNSGEIEALQDQLNRAMAVVQQVSKLKSLETLIEALTNAQITENFKVIQANILNIESSIGNIAAMIK